MTGGGGSPGPAAAGGARLVPVDVRLGGLEVAGASPGRAVRAPVTGVPDNRHED